jgi:hypothetical protein
MLELNERRVKIIQKLIPMFYKGTEMKKKWDLQYHDEPMFNITDGKVTKYVNGYYTISFEGAMYGSFSKEAFDEMKTGEILKFVEQMLNDAYDLALKLHD